MRKRSKKTYIFHEDQLPRLISWASSFEYFSFLNGNKYPALHGSFPEILFVGKSDALESNNDSFEKLNQFIIGRRDWQYGYFSYDLKNEIEELESKNATTIPVNHLGFYIPETIIHIKKGELIIESLHETDKVFQAINTHEITSGTLVTSIDQLTSQTPKWQYIDHVKKIKDEIVKGEFYEMNYCIEFTANALSFDPLSCYQQLNILSPMPFSSFMRIGGNYLICSSPERFMKKDGNTLISQPIKGTIRRSFDKKEDEQLKKALKESEKEQAENLMIVDLVRNDLAKSAKTGSVKVDELFGIYTFKKVHQMISTVTATKKQSIPVSEVIKHAFPMGSMTGAPKIRAMEEIDKLEHTARGLYSGAVGYISPDQDFDFNVVIRSIIYNSETNKLSFHVGSAITYDSDPEYEYRECLLKAESLMQVLTRK